MFITLGKRRSWPLHLGSLWCWTTEPHSRPYFQCSSATTCVVKAVSLHRLLCMCKMLSIKQTKPKPRNGPISSLDRYNCSCFSSHVVIIVGGRSFMNPLQRLWLDTIWAVSVIQKTRSWGESCAVRSQALQDCLGSADKAAWLWHRKQMQIHLRTKVTSKGCSLSDTQDKQHEFQCYSLYSAADNVRGDVKGEMQVSHGKAWLS